MASMIVTKKTLNSLGGRMNEAAGSQVSSFARRQMEKFGWTEGKGLGKNEDGISKHVKITKREENSGLGSETTKTYNNPDVSETWWHDAFEGALKKISKKKKRKRDADTDDAAPSKPPSYEELFAATGGARLGMRARADQSGKLQRTLDTKKQSSQHPMASSGDVAAPTDMKAIPSPEEECENIATEQQSLKESKKKKKEKVKKEKKQKK